MASHYLSINKGVDGNSPSDFTTGTSSSGQTFEFRYDDTLPVRAVEIHTALKRFDEYFQNAQQVLAANFPING